MAQAIPFRPTSYKKTPEVWRTAVEHNSAIRQIENLRCEARYRANHSYKPNL